MAADGPVHLAAVLLSVLAEVDSAALAVAADFLPAAELPEAGNS
jgi:hypothetical protein